MLKTLKLKRKSKEILKSLQYDSGLFAASKKNVSTGYDKAWIRDNIYEALGLEMVKDIDSVKKTYRALFDILIKHEYKIDWAIKEKPNASYKYIHARFCPFTLEEFNEEWGNKQNDAIGVFLFKVGELFEKGIPVFRNKNDIRILQKLVKYLEKIEYWHDSDNGIWENEDEVHASSIGACLAGLKKIKALVDVPEHLIEKGQKALNELLPRESDSRETDLALLTLIYPYNVVTDEQREKILYDVETKLVRDKGVIRYFDDPYYNVGGEAEWVKGFAWLAKIYKDLGNKVKYRHYMKKLKDCATKDGELPELYYADSDIPNENTPLGWTQAMFLVAIA